MLFLRRLNVFVLNFVAVTICSNISAQIKLVQLEVQ